MFVHPRHKKVNIKKLARSTRGRAFFTARHQTLTKLLNIHIFNAQEMFHDWMAVDHWAIYHHA